MNFNITTFFVSLRNKSYATIHKNQSNRRVDQWFNTVCGARPFDYFSFYIPPPVACLGRPACFLT